MRVTTSPLTREHIETLRRLRNRSRHCFFDSKFITEYAQRHWYDHIYSKCNRYDYCIHMIWYEGAIVGFFSLKYLTTIEGGIWVLEVGNLLIDPAYRGKGLMEEALRYHLGHSHCLLVAHVKEDNAASLRLFEKLGFWKVDKLPKSKSKVKGA